MAHGNYLNICTYVTPQVKYIIHTSIPRNVSMFFCVAHSLFCFQYKIRPTLSNISFQKHAKYFAKSYFSNDTLQYLHIYIASKLTQEIINIETQGIFWINDNRNVETKWQILGQCVSLTGDQLKLTENILLLKNRLFYLTF